MSVRPRVLVIGVGGLGCPAATALARAGVADLTLVDDDVVAKSNLHRQTLYTEEDVGRDKIDVAQARLGAFGGAVATVRGRFLPHNAFELIDGHQLIVEGADNLPTKFLASDAAAITGVPIVQAGAVRWSGWALASDPGSACMRCLFEDIPSDRVETCAEAGVVGPVVGVLGALQAAMAIRMLGGSTCGGELWHYEALSGDLRRKRLRARVDCPACTGEISELQPERYIAACAA